jgi:hypothetical protein
VLHCVGRVCEILVLTLLMCTTFTYCSDLVTTDSIAGRASATDRMQFVAFPLASTYSSIERSLLTPLCYLQQVESAQHEIGLWFPEGLTQHKLASEVWVYENCTYRIVYSFSNWYCLDTAIPVVNSASQTKILRLQAIKS